MPVTTLALALERTAKRSRCLRIYLAQFGTRVRSNPAACITSLMTSRPRSPILRNKSAVPTIDIDIMHPEAAAAIEALAREHFEERGYILVRFGKAPKRAILLRTDEPFKKIVRKFAMPDGSEQKLEVLSNGQQVVCYGLHKDTHQPYSWHGGEPGAVKREDLPYVRQADTKAFIDAAEHGSK